MKWMVIPDSGFQAQIWKQSTACHGLEPETQNNSVGRYYFYYAWTEWMPFFKSFIITHWIYIKHPQDSLHINTGGDSCCPQKIHNQAETRQANADNVVIKPNWFHYQPIKNLPKNVKCLIPLKSTGLFEVGLSLQIKRKWKMKWLVKKQKINEALQWSCPRGNREGHSNFLVSFAFLP